MQSRRLRRSILTSGRAGISSVAVRFGNLTERESKSLGTFGEADPVDEGERITAYDPIRGRPQQDAALFVIADGFDAYAGRFGETSDGQGLNFVG